MSALQRLVLMRLLGGMPNEAILDALIGINQIETQTCLNGKVWSAPCPNWVIRADCTRSLSWSRLLDILIRSTVGYTIEYMYNFIALRSDFCTLNLVIFKSGQNPCGPRKWPKPRCRIQKEFDGYGQNTCDTWRWSSFTQAWPMTCVSNDQDMSSASSTFPKAI